MSATSEPATLEAYFETTYCPLVLANVCFGTLRKYRSAINHANNYAQMQVTLEDLCDKFIAGLTAYLLEMGMSDDMTRTHRQHLRAIAADAQNRGHSTGWLSTRDPLGNNVGGNRRMHFKRDMRGPKAKTRRLIAKAATLFAGGYTWQEIGEQLGMPFETLHTWRTRYRKVWDAAYGKASEKVIESVKGEAAKHAVSIRRAAHVRRAWAAERALARTDETLVQDTEPASGKRISELIMDLNIERAWSVGNLKTYRATLRLAERWCGRTLYASEFDRGWVNDFLLELENSHLAPATIRGRRMELLCLWRAAFDAHLCPVLPTKIRRIAFVHKPPEAWLYDEVQLLVKQAAMLRGSYEIVDPGSGSKREIDAALWWRLAIRLFWDTGLRSGDIGRLKASDVDPDGILPITQGKTGNWHVCRLHPSTMALLAQTNPTATCRMLPWDKSDGYRGMQFAYRILEPTGLKGSLKKLRKSSASDVELHHPGLGGVHLGHRMSVNIAHCHYLDFRIVAANRPMPTELTADLDGAAKGGAS